MRASRAYSLAGDSYRRRSALARRLLRDLLPEGTAVRYLLAGESQLTDALKEHDDIAHGRQTNRAEAHVDASRTRGGKPERAAYDDYIGHGQLN